MIWFMVQLQNLEMNIQLKLPASALYQHAVVKGHQTIQTELMTLKILKSKQELWSMKVNKTCFFQPVYVWKCPIVHSSHHHQRIQESGQIWSKDKAKTLKPRTIKMLRYYYFVFQVVRYLWELFLLFFTFIRYENMKVLIQSERRGPVFLDALLPTPMTNSQFISSP